MGVLDSMSRSPKFIKLCNFVDIKLYRNRITYTNLAISILSVTLICNHNKIEVIKSGAAFVNQKINHFQPFNLQPYQVKRLKLAICEIKIARPPFEVQSTKNNLCILFIIGKKKLFYGKRILWGSEWEPIQYKWICFQSNSYLTINNSVR